MKYLRLSLIAVLMSIAMSTVASAQLVDGDRAGIQRRNLVSSNPIGLLFEWYQGEYERAFSDAFSLAVAGASFNLSDDDVASVDVIGRYYPGGRALRGFSLGATAGFSGITEEVCDQVSCREEDYSAFTLGVRGDYVWILGREQHLAVAAGVGAKRLFSDRIDGIEGLPVGRLSIGYAW